MQKKPFGAFFMRFFVNCLIFAVFMGKIIYPIRVALKPYVSRVFVFFHRVIHSRIPPSGRGFSIFVLIYPMGNHKIPLHPMNGPKDPLWKTF